MTRTVAFVFLALALMAQASAFMLAPTGSVVGAACRFQGPAISSFSGVSVRERDSTLSSGTLRMMRHGKRVKKLGLPADHRKALLRALTTEVIRHGRIKTTLVRARAVRKHVDHMIQLSKDGSLHARRQAMGYIYDKQLVHALFEAGADRYGERNGGYCRVKREVKNRKGDNAEMAIIELV